MSGAVKASGTAEATFGARDGSVAGEPKLRGWEFSCPGRLPRPDVALLSIGISGGARSATRRTLQAARCDPERSGGEGRAYGETQTTLRTRGRVIVSPAMAVSADRVRVLPAIDSGKTFELWVIPGQRKSDSGRNVSRPDGCHRGFRAAGRCDNAAAVAVTVEPRADPRTDDDAIHRYEALSSDCTSGVVEPLDIREKGGMRGGEQQTSDRRLFMQLLAFGNAGDTAEASPRRWRVRHWKASSMRTPTIRAASGC